MHSLRCIIIDDEPLAQDVLERYVTDTPGLECVAILDDALKAMSFLEKEKVDLMMLDIHMPKLSGMHLLQSLKNPPLTILTTAYAEYALQGYEMDVVDYLMKPISFERFLKAIQKVRERLAPQKTAHKPTISLKADKKIYRIEPNEIMYLEGLGDYVKVFLLGGNKPLIVQETMKAMSESLGAGFLRIHKSYLLNSAQIAFMDGNELVLSQGGRLPIGYSYRKTVSDFMLNQ